MCYREPAPSGGVQGAVRERLHRQPGPRLHLLELGEQPRAAADDRLELGHLTAPGGGEAMACTLCVSVVIPTQNIQRHTRKTAPWAPPGGWGGWHLAQAVAGAQQFTDAHAEGDNLALSFVWQPYAVVRLVPLSRLSRHSASPFKGPRRVSSLKRSS